MKQVLVNLFAQFSSFYKTLPPMKRASISVAAGIIVISLVIVSFMLSKTNYATLFRNIPEDQLAVIVDKLQKNNIPFQMKDNGTTVLIPSQLLSSTQMLIMSELGDSKIGTMGLELFEKQDFGVTSYAQKINYQRALQGELMRAINSLDVVKKTKVILALPPKKTFLEESAEPSASVIVELEMGKSLNQNQVKGITHLVASAVEKMSPEKVTVVDSRGKVLSRNSDAATAASSELIEMKTKIEEQLETRIDGILARVVGTGKVMARVDVQLNPQHVQTLQELVDPDSTALRSSVTEEEVLDGARTNPTGIPGARANLPGAGDQGQVGFKQNVRKELKTMNYSVPKTTKRIKESAGAIKKISVAVLVDGKTVATTGEDGAVSEEWTARTAAELAQYESIVKNSIGFDASRGDSVKIENMRFQKEDFAEAEKLLTSIERKKLFHSLFKWALLGFSLALFFFIVIRPFMRWITDSFQDTVEDMLPRTIEELEELQSVDNSLPGMSGAMPVLERSIDPNKAESELLRERIMVIIEDDEEKAAGAFGLWISNKEL